MTGKPTRTAWCPVGLFAQEPLGQTKVSKEASSLCPPLDVQGAHNRYLLGGDKVSWSLVGVIGPADSVYGFITPSSATTKEGRWKVIYRVLEEEVSVGLLT